MKRPLTGRKICQCPDMSVICATHICRLDSQVLRLILESSESIEPNIADFETISDNHLGSASIRSLAPCAMELTRHLTVLVRRMRARCMFGHISQQDMLRPQLDIAGAAISEISPDEP